MKSTSKFAIILLISLLSIGFAAVATNLIINGQSNISSNSIDFDIYFTRASTEEGGSAVIDTADKKQISFASRKLKFVGSETYLDYTVYNNSSLYDANVNVEFTATNVINNVDYSDYYTIEFEGISPTSSGSTTLIPAKSSISGKIIITLNKVVLDDVQIEFSLTLTPSATERTEEGIYTPNYQIISGDLNTVGSVIKIADEEFYVIGQEDDQHVKLFAKYNLNVGNNIQPGTEGIQNSLAIGYNKNSSTVVDNYYPATVPFSSTNYWYDGSNLKSAYGSFFPAYVYDDNASIKTYVDEYVEYLEAQGVSVTGRLIKQEELVSLGCNVSNHRCSSAPAWVYQTSFWSGSAYDSIGVWDVITSGQFNYYTFYYSNSLGVRPVIILEK
jgi:hypothetical protein